jgi:hypothetical protein
MNGVDMNGEPAGTPAFSFFFSRLLRNWPFAVLSSLARGTKKCFRVKECCSSPEERPIFR